MDNIVKIGDTFSDLEPPTSFQLIVNDHITAVRPSDFGLDRACIDPNEYFITSGDAVEKAKILNKDLWLLAASLRKEILLLLIDEHKCDMRQAIDLLKNNIPPSLNKTLVEYNNAIYVAAYNAFKLLNALIRAKGPNCFLEIEWKDHVIICVPKNPRK